MKGLGQSFKYSCAADDEGSAMWLASNFKEARIAQWVAHSANDLRVKSSIPVVDGNI